MTAICASGPAEAQWTAAGSGMDFYVHTSAVYNDELYAGGNFEHADGNECLGIAKWNGSAWSSVGGGFQHDALNHVVSALTVFNNELVAGGWVDSVGGMPINHVARWNGTSWSPMGTDCQINTPRGFAIHNGELYMCGEASGALYPHCIEKWNGTNWVPIENSNGTTEVSAIASYNGELYAAGNFPTLDGATVNGIARWNGTTWSDVGGSIPNIGVTDIVKALAVFNGKLYAGGHFASVGSATVRDIAAWDGSAWAEVGGGVGGSTAAVQSLLTNGDMLFVGGTYWEVNGVDANRAAAWDGSAWTVFGTDLGAGARTQAIYNGELYSLGEGAFNNQSYAAKWTGDSFSTIEEVNALATVLLAPNPVSQGGTLAIDLRGQHTTRLAGFTLISADGRIVRNERFGQVAVDRVVLAVGDLKTGAYTVLLNDAEGIPVGRARLVVQ